METVIFRADAHRQMGTGHIMRCIALAQALEARGGKAVFVSWQGGGKAMSERLHAEGFTVEPFGAGPTSDDNLIHVGHTAHKYSARWIVVDGYHLDANYQRELKKMGLSVLALDDTADAAEYTADIILNGNAYAADLPYPKTSPPRWLLGPDYTPLRREFTSWRGWRRETPAQAHKVLVTFGGSDPLNLTALAIDALRDSPYDVRVIMGGASLETEPTPAPNLTFLRAVTDMPEQIAWADLAVAACGSTSWEFALLGLPAVSVVVAENQRYIGAWLEQMKLATVVHPPSELTAAHLRTLVDALAADQPGREYAAALGPAVIDGLGADRVVRHLLAGDEPDLQVHPATPADANRIWWWANDPVTRANSFNPNPIPWTGHQGWYARQLALVAENKVRFWFLEHQGVPVGHIRYACEDDGALISFNVSPDQRGKGYGTALLRETAALACAELNVPRVFGETLDHNLASQHAFRKAGFTELEPTTRDGQRYFSFEWRC